MRSVETRCYAKQLGLIITLMGLGSFARFGGRYIDKVFAVGANTP
jgi:hypothetical protein